jgi:hypothetical protein
MRNQLIFMNLWHYVKIDELSSSTILIVEISIEEIFNVFVVSSTSKKIKKFKIDNLKTIAIIRNRLKCNDRDLLKNKINVIKNVTNFQEIVQFVRIKNIKWFVHQIVNHHFNHQSKRHRLRATIQKNFTRHTKNDHRNVHQWQHFDFLLSFRFRREIQAISKALCSDARNRVCRIQSRNENQERRRHLNEALHSLWTQLSREERMSKQAFSSQTKSRLI